MNKGIGRAPGIDNIQPEILRHLPTVGQEALIALLNRSWRTSEVPGCWKTAIVTPILKKGKPANEVKSYRPVSLLPCSVKLLERMVMTRLDAWQRSLGIVPTEQAGFTPGRSTTDCIAQLVQPMFDALQPRRSPQRTLLTAIDLKAAFDRVWHPDL